MSILEFVGRPIRSRDAAGVYPMDPPRASASGPSPYRILLVGSELLAGRGVATHDLALTGCLARALGGGLGHGVDVEALVVRGKGLAGYEHALRHRPMAHLDAVVLLLEPDQAAKSVGSLRKALLGLSERLAGTASLTVVVPPAGTLQGGVETVGAVRSAARSIADVIELEPAPAAPHQPVERYIAWAEDIAHSLVTRLGAPRLLAGVAEPVDERSRRRAVRQAGAVVPSIEQAMQRIVNFAAAGYRTKSAGISLIDEETTQYFAARNMDYLQQAAETSLCDTAMRTYGGLIVGDARLDPRFQEFDVVRGGGVTFYAGHRILSPEGLPIGALCVFDPEPRAVQEQDLVLLRDFAMAAERQLWRSWPDGSLARTRLPLAGAIPG